jgi:hypothetical protein
MRKQYTAQELSESPLKECVEKTAKINKVDEEHVIDHLTQKPGIR